MMTSLPVVLAAALTALPPALSSLFRLPPEQVHLAPSSAACDSMRVAWVTRENASQPLAQSGVTWSLGACGGGGARHSTGNATLFTADYFFPGPHDRAVASPRRNWTNHVAQMTQLHPGSLYCYRVGGASTGWSPGFSFRARQDCGGRAFPPQRHVLFGDMGASFSYALCRDCCPGIGCTYKNPAFCEDVFQCACICHDRTSGGLVSEVSKAALFVHVGDLAYDLWTNGGRVGDRFMNNIEPLAASVPYIIAHGNHEAGQQFAHSTERFRHMPTSDPDPVWTQNGHAPNNWFYSFDAGLIHYIAIMTPLYDVGPNASAPGPNYTQLVARQYRWVQQDLAKANANREKIPWIVAFGHYPMYCGNSIGCDQTPATAALREGPFGLEQVFHVAGLDMYVAAHYHDYERMFDIYQNRSSRTMVDPPATVHVTTGAGGSDEALNGFADCPASNRTAKRLSHFGYSVLTAENHSHLRVQFVATDYAPRWPNGSSSGGGGTGGGGDRYGSVQDDVWLIQHTHGTRDDVPAPDVPAPAPPYR